MSADGEVQLARHRMVRKQLQDRGIHDRGVLAAMGRIPRELFVEVANPMDAYSDRALSIDCEQTISQPYIVALMTQALELSGRESVLEIGTGSGYQTAVLAELCRSVVSVERYAELSSAAAGRLAELGYANVTLVVGDGTLGWPAHAPYDRIIVTAAAAEFPPALLEQLAADGLLVAPIGDRSGQVLRCLRRTAGGDQVMELASCRFVPLVGAASPLE